MKRANRDRQTCLREAQRALFITSFEALNEQVDSDGEDFAPIEEVLVGKQGVDDAHFWMYQVGVAALEGGLSFRHVLVWLYLMQGFKLWEVGKRFQLSGERIRQMRCQLEEFHGEGRHR